jgi:hypothetical protein
MIKCPFCNKPMVELSELTGFSFYDLLNWCMNCGSIVYSGNNEMQAFPSLLSQKPQSRPRLFDIVAESSPAGNL